MVIAAKEMPLTVAKQVPITKERLDLTLMINNRKAISVNVRNINNKSAFKKNLDDRNCLIPVNVFLSIYLSLFVL